MNKDYINRKDLLSPINNTIEDIKSRASNRRKWKKILENYFILPENSNNLIKLESLKEDNNETSFIFPAVENYNKGVEK